MINNTKIITNHWGKINPKKIQDYVNVGGYGSLRKFIRDMNEEEAIVEIKKSGLCGRGGAGFLTGEKLALVASHPGKEKYFICNLDESEPGTYKDRMIAAKNPHLLIEGIIILSLIIGAKKSYIYINGNFEKEAELLEGAIRQAKEKEFLGRGIIGSCYDAEVEIFRGAGAYVCGEETALINSMEGNRGEPTSRPPYPTESGLFGKPTLVNNAETVSNIPWIIMNGGEKYASMGSPLSPGMKLYILGGAVKNIGVFEGLTGLTLRQIISDLGGGIQKGKEFWFAQIGGASGRLATKEDMDKKLDFSRDSDIQIGSGSVLVVDKSLNIHDLLLSWTGFFRRESCGKCAPCREGTFRLWEIAKRFQDGEITDRDKEAIIDILWTLENTTFCPLGKFAAVAFRDAVEKLKILN